MIEPGNVWEKWEAGDWIVISTNLQGIHGRGLAAQAKCKGFIRQRENYCVAMSPVEHRILTVAVKGWAPETARLEGKTWSEQVVGRNLALLEQELGAALDWFEQAGTGRRLWVPLIGTGFGEGDKATVLALLTRLVEGYPSASLISPAPSIKELYARELAPGISRDSSFDVQPA